MVPILSPGRWWVRAMGWAGAAGFGFGAGASSGGEDALAGYVARSDTNYLWKKLDQKQDGSFTVTHVELRSQDWRGHLWTHDLQLVRPDKVRNPRTGFLFITGDGRGTRQLEMLKILAERAGTMAAVITKVPNQPLYENRKEDALIAYTFDQYLKSGDETWPLLFPMVKSAVRAMDAVQALAGQDHGENLERFVVAGASKRGWTTWLTAAVDPRVAAMAPMVIDTLNMKVQTDWAQKVYGRQSEEISDYTDLGLVKQTDDPPMTRLRSWVDPFSYRQRYTMPKLILIGTNDPYWTVDSLRHYFHDLPETKLVFQTPNAGHDLAGGKEATQTLAAFFQMIADGQSLPRLSWHFREAASGEVEVRLNLTPQAESARLWTANSTDRDFRNDLWTSQTLEIKPGRSNSISALVPPPGQGYRAYLAEVTFKAPTGQEYRLSTEARVTPDNIK